MADLVGQKLGNYQIIKKLGEGGFAEVYLAENIHLKGMLVAIKIAKDTLPERAREQFFKEADIIRQFRHPHIVRLLNFGLHNNLPYLVMDYFEEGSLRDRHPKGTKLDSFTIVNYVRQIADALQYAHDNDRKTIHRDIKPDNILGEKGNAVLLSDFGIAIVIETTNYTAGNHGPTGSFQYMSPEHFTGHLRSASDQYSLAIMVYEWLCGTPPFTEGNFIQMGYQHTHESPPSLHDNIAILPAVEEVVMKGLAKKPKERYASVTEFAQALEEAFKFPDDSYYPQDVAQAIRDCYFRSSRIANNLGAPVNHSPCETESALIRSRRGTAGYKRSFEKGTIYWCERGGAQPTFLGFGYIHKAWGGIEGSLGFPLSEDGDAAPSPQGSTGSFQRFEGEEDYPEDVDTPPIWCGATTYWRSPDRYVYAVMGKIGECYERLHGTAGFLGFPRSNALNIGPFMLGSSGMCQSFEGGSIYWKEGSAKAFPVGKIIEESYHRDSDVRFRLGFPIDSGSRTITSPQGTTGKYQRFEGGLNDGWPTGDGGSDHSKGVSVYWSKKYGAYPIMGGLGICYAHLGGARSSLGFPIEGECKLQDGTDRWCQKFEGGVIYWCEEFGGVPVIGTIFEAYEAIGGPSGKFGFPKAPRNRVSEQLKDSYIQEFEGGVISVCPEPRVKAYKWEMDHVPPIVDQVYHQVLHRPVDPSGLITYGSQLNRGEKSVRDIVKVLGRSNEFRREILGIKSIDASVAESGYEKVDLCIERLLGRGADLPIKSTYIELLKEQGFGRVINDLVDSEEYTLAFGENCAPITTSGLSVISQVPEKLHCFYRGLNGHLSHRKGTLQRKSWDNDVIDQDAPTIPVGSGESVILSWDNEDKDEGGYLTSAPSAVSWGPIHLECFYRGGDNCLWHRWWYGSGPSHEGSLGGFLTSAPTVVSTGENSMDCFYRGANNHLLWLHWEGKEWSQEVDLGGFLTSAPAVVSWGPKHLECFYRDSDGGLCHRRRYDKGWSEEHNLGGYMTSAPSVTSTGENFLDCFYRGLNFHLFHRHWDGENWTEEEDLGGFLASAPAVVYLGEGYIGCFYRGQGRCLWHRRGYGKRWNQEENLGGILI